MSDIHPGLKLQRWRSDDDQEEQHVFVRGSDVYVFGFNPAFFPPGVVERILAEAEPQLEAYLTRRGPLEDL